MTAGPGGSAPARRPSGRRRSAVGPRVALLASWALIASTACDAGDASHPQSRAAPASATSTTATPTAATPTAAAAADVSRRAPAPYVDSILPPGEALHRLRDALGPKPDGLTGGAPTRDELVGRFLRALAARDTAAFARMLLGPEEFAWLYYPHARYTARPYEQAPQLVWFQIRNGSSKGLGRLLARVGGAGIDPRGYTCAPAPRSEGPNRVWEDCLVVVLGPGGRILERQLFGSILERDGVFKFISYVNDY